MRRVSHLAVPVLALSFVAWAAGAAAQAEKTARGTVKAVAADSVTVTVGAADMKFGVDAKTTVVARGAGTASRQAQAAGAAGPKLVDVVKVGGAVEVKYHDTGGTLHAASIRSVASAGEGGGSMAEAKPAAKTTSGTVKTISASSLVVTGGGKDWTFSIDGTTKVVGRGVGTKAAETGGKAAITALIDAGDMVSVTYHEMGATMHAANVNITTKAKK